MDFNWSLLDFIGPYASLWVFVGPHGSLCVLINSNGSLGGIKIPFALLCFLMGSLWVLIGPIHF